jgi:predicted aspartyl protease
MALTMGLMLATAARAQADAETDAQRAERHRATMGYASVAQALEQLRKRPDVQIDERDGWVKIMEPATDQGIVIWMFTPADHPAHPAVVKTTMFEAGGAMQMRTDLVCEAARAVCDRLLSEFQALTATAEKRAERDLLRRTGRDRVALPAEFRHDLIWVAPAIEGRVLRFFTDTGGGWNALREDLARKLQRETLIVRMDDGALKEFIAFPAFDAGQAIPAAPAYFMRGMLALGGKNELGDMDGFLGARWFADGVWEFDYRQRSLNRLYAFEGTADDPHRLSLGFQVDAQGQRTMHFPRMRARIDGEELDFLLDTGATATLTERSAAVFKLKAGTRIGTSFIEHAVFERWVQRHPQWRVLERADQKKDARRMIEVPKIDIAGHSVGPVWFAEQPAGAFQQYMSSMMDQPVWGALGGSALRHFRLIIDYPNAAAYFHRD